MDTPTLPKHHQGAAVSSYPPAHPNSGHLWLGKCQRAAHSLRHQTHFTLACQHKPARKNQSQAHKSLPSLATCTRHQILNQARYLARLQGPAAFCTDSSRVLTAEDASVTPRATVAWGGPCLAKGITQASRSKERRGTGHSMDLAFIQH